MAITDEQLEQIVVRRARLIQFLILVIAMIQCVVLYAVLSGRTDWTVPTAVVVALFALPVHRSQGAKTFTPPLGSVSGSCQS